MKGYYTIIVKFKTTPDQKEHFKRFLKSIIRVALENPGCLKHDLHESLENDGEFLFYENWINKEAHEKHVQRQEVQKWRAKLADFLIQPYEVSFWEILGGHQI